MRAFIKYGIILVAGCITTVLLYSVLYYSRYHSYSTTLTLHVQSALSIDWELFTEVNHEYSPQHAQLQRLLGSSQTQTLTFQANPIDSTGKIRLDPGVGEHQIFIHQFVFKGPSGEVVWNADSLLQYIKPIREIQTIQKVDNSVRITTRGADPSFEIKRPLHHIIRPIQNPPNIDIGYAVLAILGGSICCIFMAKSRHLWSLEITQKVYVGGTCIILSTPLILWFFPGAYQQNQREKRMAAPPATFSMDKIWQYSSAFSAYFNDQFPLRNEAVTANSYLLLKAFGQSSIPEKVLIGTDNWLFYNGPTTDSLHKDKAEFSAKQLEKIITNLSQTYRYLQAKNIPFYVYVAPHKGSIYSHKLPHWMHPPLYNKRTLQLKEALTQAQLPIWIDTHQELQALAQSEEVFYPYDTHWNTRGAHVGYQAIMQKLMHHDSSLNYHPIEQYTPILHTDSTADLAMMLGLESILKKQEYKLTPLYKPRAKFMGGVQALQFQELALTLELGIPQSNEPRLLLYRDSFSNALIPYLSEHFSRTFCVWSYQIQARTIEDFKPNFVVIEIVEHNLPLLLYTPVL